MIVRFIFILASINSWHTFEIDQVLSFSPVPIDLDLYIEIPKRVEIDLTLRNNQIHVLEFLKNIYGQKQASRQFYI